MASGGKICDFKWAEGIQEITSVCVSKGRPHCGSGLTVGVVSLWEWSHCGSGSGLNVGVTSLWGGLTMGVGVASLWEWPQLRDHIM